MKHGIKTIDDFEIKGKTVLLRVDINQPVDMETGKLKDVTRIKRCINTIKEISNKGGKVVIIAHQGSDIEYKNYYTTKPHAKVISEMLGKEVKFIEDVCGPAAQLEIYKLKDGEIIMLDNVRYAAEEMTLFETKLKLSPKQQSKTQVVQKLYPLGDIYLCDAFAAAHRSQPSLIGFQQLMPSGMGRLFEEELDVLTKIMENPQRPCVFVLGGAKIADAFIMMESVLENKIADTVITGGLVAHVILMAIGEKIGKASEEFIYKKNLEGNIEQAKKIMEKYCDKIKLPKDFAYLKGGERKETVLENMPDTEAIMDIGKETSKEYAQIINETATIFVNGPMGVFEEEKTGYGTKEVFTAINESKGFSVVGGGDSISALNKYALENIDYICTAGGGLVRFLSGEELPVIKALRNS